ncbi:MAG: Nickel and cobalt resistance protein CnrA [Formosa sp. Hel3_A1_48]|nr:MAG: Nickel and cobalt resistance protein CnrA [Formosa sp. Hel3_A1_48]
MRKALSKISLLKDISDTDPEGVKEVRLSLKPSAYALGLDLNSVMRQVRSAFFGAEAQRFQRGQDEIRVWVRYDKKDRNSLNDLSLMRLLTPSGQRVPLTEIADYSIARGDVSINRLYNAREIQVNAGIKDPDETGNVIVKIQNEIVPAILERYPTVSALYEGQSREIGKLANSFSRAAPILFLLIYLTIAFTFRSYSQPLLLMVMIPFSLVGVAWGHYIHGFPINALSLLGIIALIGIMVNDGLVLISKLNNYLREGMPFQEALIASGKSRFRAIFLTSITTVAGLAPLILEKSFNAQFLIPMAISIAYGIAFATFLTLLVLPLLLSWSNSFKGNLRYLIKGERVAPESLERAVRELKESNEN